MGRTEIERTVRPSLLDRLSDTEPGFAADPPVTREESERRYRLGVERDVEALLNTRRTMVPAPEWCPELRKSVYDYGLIDTTGVPVGTKAGRDRLLSALQDAIERFEPRLAQPRVRLIDAQQLRAPQVRFVLEAVLVMDPGREDVVFDTVLEIASGEYDVRDNDAAPSGG
jgi:type VI secretion system protein ImpF